MLFVLPLSDKICHSPSKSEKTNYLDISFSWQSPSLFFEGQSKQKIQAGIRPAPYITWVVWQNSPHKDACFPYLTFIWRTCICLKRHRYGPCSLNFLLKKSISHPLYPRFRILYPRLCLSYTHTPAPLSTPSCLDCHLLPFLKNHFKKKTYKKKNIWVSNSLQRLSADEQSYN